MYFRRKIDSYLRQWKDKENRLPLIIKGARQIGKTESIVHFASENYENIVFINFVLEGQNVAKYTTGVNSVMHNNGCCNHTHTNHTSYRKVGTC